MFNVSSVITDNCYTHTQALGLDLVVMNAGLCLALLGVIIVITFLVRGAVVKLQLLWNFISFSFNYKEEFLM